jgi:hypothetical protein
MRGSRRRWVGALAGALVAGLTGYFVAVGAHQASEVAGPVGAVIALVALLAQLFPMPSEERTVARRGKRTEAAPERHLKANFGIIVRVFQSRTGVVAITVVALVALVVIVVLARDRDASGTLTPSPSTAPSPTVTSSPSPEVLPTASPSPTPSRDGSPMPRPSRSSVGPNPTRPAATTPVARSPLPLYNGAEYVALYTTGPKLVGQTDGPDVEIETLTADPLGKGIAAPDAAKSCGSVQWRDTPLRFDIAARPSFCVRSRLGEIWLLELEPTVDGPDRPRPYLATFTKLA